MPQTPLAMRPREAEPDWPLGPAVEDRPVVFLLDAASSLEEQILRGWIERHRPEGAFDDAIAIPATRRRRHGRTALDPRLEEALATREDPLLAPLRVAWLAPKRGDRRTAGPGDLLRLGDPRDPGLLRERWVASRASDRCRIVAGEPATSSELRRRWTEAGGSDEAQTLGLAEFVVRQAQLALERAERRLRGARYKVPRFVHDDILSRPSFRGGVARMAREQGRREARVLRQARRYLHEIAATHSPFVIDLVVQLWRRLFRRGYRELRYDAESLERIGQLAQRHPLVFIPTHKSNLDHPVIQYMLHENGLPPNHTAGGINMNFFPLGPLVRRSGVFFIRRSFKDNEVYKFVLQHYIDYLIEKRFSLEFFMEGGRSRSGKLLPPRFGMLAYVVDAYRRGRSDDVLILPISIAYDQISDVGDYAQEARGGAKESESLGWFLRFIRRLGHQYGNIEIRFGEPLSLQKALGQPDPEAPPNPDEKSLDLQKLAFETCVRINRATPITPTSLVTLALLGRGDRALSVAEMQEALANLLAYVARRELPTTNPNALDSAEGVASAMNDLVANGVLTRLDEGPVPVWSIGAEQHLAAAYYRNTVIHFFVNGAIAELALLRVSEEAERTDLGEPFWDEVMELRDLLKFEFFFAEKDAFVGEIRQELALHEGSWEARRSRGRDAVQGLYSRLRPYHSHRILRPFLEAYRVVGDVLEQRDPAEEVDEKRLLDACLALGRQYSLQRHIRSEESVSKVLFGNGLKLARNRGLLATGGPELAAQRSAFAEQLRQVLRRVDAVEALVRARHAGLMD